MYAQVTDPRGKPNAERIPDPAPRKSNEVSWDSAPYIGCFNPARAGDHDCQLARQAKQQTGFVDKETQPKKNTPGKYYFSK